MAIWSVIESIAGTPWLWSLSFVSESVGWVVGWDGFVLKTTDGGTTFNQQVAPTSEPMWSVSAVDENTVWIAAGVTGGIHKTLDGGSSWIDKTPPPLLASLTSRDSFRRVIAISADIVYIQTPSGGRVMKTVDGGDNWTELRAFVQNPPPQVAQPVNGFEVTSDGTLYVGGFKTNTGPMFIERSADGGVTWDETILTGSDTLQFPVYLIKFATPLIGYAFAARYVFKTTDGGATWNEVYAFPNTFGPYSVGAIVFTGVNLIDENRILVSTSLEGIWRSEDGGVTWDQEDLGSIVSSIPYNPSLATRADGTVMDLTTLNNGAVGFASTGKGDILGMTDTAVPVTPSVDADPICINAASTINSLQAPTALTSEWNSPLPTLSPVLNYWRKFVESHTEDPQTMLTSFQTGNFSMRDIAGNEINNPLLAGQKVKDVQFFDPFNVGTASGTSAPITDTLMSVSGGGGSLSVGYSAHIDNLGASVINTQIAAVNLRAYHAGFVADAYSKLGQALQEMDDGIDALHNCISALWSYKAPDPGP